MKVINTIEIYIYYILMIYTGYVVFFTKKLTE